jgi:hypothetical protein
VTITFPRSGGMFGIPNEAKEITEEEVKEFFPTEDVIEAWARGEKAPWPPEDEVWDDDYPEFPPVRFQVGARVECRTGQDEWVRGKVILVWYREPHWPVNSWAPYQIQLDDGRLIFAPADTEQVIRAVESSSNSS